MTNYFSKFVKDYARVVIPLTDLLKKDCFGRWEEREQRAFEELKQALTSAPVLKVADPKVPFHVYTDASGFAIGGWLGQDEGQGCRPVAYESRKMTPAERNYPVHEQELLAVVHVLRTWRPYLEGQRFKVYTDHRSLVWLQTQPNLSQHQVRWVQFLQGFDFEIEYKPGKWNTVADALSRRADHQQCACGRQELHVILEVGAEWCQGLPDQLAADAYFSEVYRALRQGEPATKESAKKAKHITCRDDLLYFKKD